VNPTAEAPSSPGAPPRAAAARVAGFRTKLWVGMMGVVSIVTVVASYVAERNLAAGVERERQREFQAELAAQHHTQEIRHAALVERCRALARKPRIHAALEDNALDLLYPSAKDELRDVMAADWAPGSEPAAGALHGQFYRFLRVGGGVIPPPPGADVGALAPAEERQLALQGLPEQQQLGYIARAAGDALAEVIATPIHSSETGEVIAALVLGFNPAEFGGARPGAGIRSGIWVGGRLHLAGISAAAAAAIAGEVARAVAAPARSGEPLRFALDGLPHLLFAKQLNPGSLFPPAYEVCIYPLAELLARQRQLRWEVLGAGALLLLGALGVSQVMAARLSRPVEKLAVDSEENRRQRVRAESALEATHEELQRSARFSADASHQLKTPVTVLRAGLEELIAQEHLSPETREEIAALVHQTFRLSSVIEDLLLLSRMDAGRLKLALVPVNLTQLIEAALDDLSAQPDAPEIAVETDFPPALHMAGEKRYTSLILQNLLENARKYNRPDGRIRVTARAADGRITLTVGNTGRPIPAAARAHIFERFHRGAMGENVPGYGLGLNLARELARLHHGDLRLARSEGDWTEFAVEFRAAEPAAAPVP
jgi:signal transduction histidine kinase